MTKNRIDQLRLDHLKKIGIICTIFIVLIACSKNSNLVVLLLPQADFEEQESTMICWNPKFQQVILPLVAEISGDDHVTLFFNENLHPKKRIQNLLTQHKANIKNISLLPFKLENDNIWIRDYGPTFRTNSEGNIAMIGFEYPHLQYKDYEEFSSQYALKFKIPFQKSKMFGTGGGREINGKGTIILIEGYEEFINPTMSKIEIEAEYREKFGQTNFIWLKKGIPQDDLMRTGPILENIYGGGVNWHIDEFCRFSDSKTILLAEVDSADIERDEFYRIIFNRLEENYKILRASKDQDGNPFEIIRVPQAPVIFADGFRDTVPILYTPVTSYLNFVVTNNSVIIPTYYVDQAPDYVREKDEKAVMAFQKAFKNRQIKMLDAIDLNYKGGGLHCITLSKPKIKKKNWYSSYFPKRKLG